jgi:hypothetical protein
MADNRPVLDWRAYYLAFQEAHGEPVNWSGKLLFRDGYTYAAKDYSGPEWPPPQDPKELRRLQRAYWQIRKANLTHLLRVRRADLLALHEMQAARSVPLQHKTCIRDDQGTKVQAQALNLRDLEDRLRWTEHDLLECQERLDALNGDLE